MPKGTITHIEFPADDLERAQRFYAAVAGWEFGPMEGFPDYVLFQSGEEGHGGGIGTRGASVASTLRIYITVDRLEDAIAAAEANGGSVTAAAQDVPGQGRFAVVKDSEGTEVALWENAEA
jgi:predicted enzyme related to lactoylglutathione lyase